MPIFEARPAEAADFDGPEPPPPGSAAYRRVILNICATQNGADYERLMRPVFQWRGWRAAVEVMVEITGALSMNAPGRYPRCLDAFGNIRLDDHTFLMDDEAILRQAHEFAPVQHPDLPRHEALRTSIREGEETRELVVSLLPYWNQAATALRKAETLADLDGARALFTRWLNDHYKTQRVWASTMGAASTHAYWRGVAMPPGSGWVDELVSTQPNLRGPAIPAPIAGWTDSG